MFKKDTYASENDECHVENDQSQQQDNLGSVLLECLFFASLRASFKKKYVTYEAVEQGSSTRMQKLRMFCSGLLKSYWSPLLTLTSVPWEGHR